MRIMLIAPPWLPVPPQSYGGTEAVIDLLARGYAAAGHDVLLCTTGDSTCPVEQRSFYAEGQGILAGAPVELRHLIHAYKASADFDIVHDHTLLGPLYAATGAPAPVVTTNHGTFDDELRTVYQEIGPHTPIIAISHSQAASAANIPIAAVIHHGVDPLQFPFCAEPDDYWLFLGRMSAAKGVHRAARIARDAGIRLVIAAKMREPGEQRYFEQYVRPLLDDCVTFVGEVGYREKLELLAAARGLLNPIGWREPFGLVMIEALACGTPVLTFPIGAAPEIVQHGKTGFLCADEAEMAKRLRDVEELDRRACRRSVERDFSAPRMVSDHLALYEQLVASERAVA
jgi:glycosyltransferase involved in cell wall biosynthesis